MKRGFRTTVVSIGSTTLKLYASQRVADAVAELSKDMTLYHGVRFAQVMDAVYKQGMKDGAARVINEFEKVKKLIPHKGPGRPSK